LDQKLINPKQKWKRGQKQKFLILRGSGNPEDGDFIYGSIYETPLEKETIVGLQSKLLHMLGVLQCADVRPTKQAEVAVEKLLDRVKEVLNKAN